MELFGAHGALVACHGTYLARLGKVLRYDFGSAVKDLDKCFNRNCIGITFKRLLVGNQCDVSDVCARLAGQVLPTVMLD
jgi:hypothetical protein